MLIHLNSITKTNIEFVFNSEHIHHIYKQEGMNDNMVLVLDDGTNRVISNEQYMEIIKILDSNLWYAGD